MIGEKLIIHDKFSIELKLSYEKQIEKRVSDFSIDLWFFIPNSLDVNSDNYKKEQFYSDLKTNIRLINPVYLLNQICDGDNSPYGNLSYAVNCYLNNKIKKTENELEYNIRMFISIFKASFRNSVNEIKNLSDNSEARCQIKKLLNVLDIIINSYRKLKTSINTEQCSRLILNSYILGDEYISILVEQNLFYLLKSLKNNNNRDIYLEQRKDIIYYISSLLNYKKKMSYACVCKNDKNINLEIIYKRGVLKKYFEGILFLSTRTKKDGVFVTQLFYGISAAVAMIFATSLAFLFQQEFGNLTLPFFVAIVIIYVFKDRIKDVSKLYFKGKINKIFYDIKTYIKVKNNKNIGWCKESFNFVTKKAIPPQVLSYRNKFRIIDVESRASSEKIFFYRKILKLKNHKLDSLYEKYNVIGINDIIRFNITRFITKMDNPEVPLYIINENEESYEKIYGDKVYFMNLILRYRDDNVFKYSKYRLVFNRLGIQKIDKM